MQKRQNNKELYDKYITPNMGDVKTLVRYYNNNSYGGDYEEMLSEVCVNFFKHIHTYDPSKRLSTWIHICVQREVARIFRRKQRENETYDQFGSYSEADFCTSNETAVEPDDCLDESWYREHVGDEMLLALRRLEPQYRTVFLMKYIGGYRIKDIQHYINNVEHKEVSISAIKCRLKTAREKLSRSLRFSNVISDIKSQSK